jgi:hypothetical protein
VSSVVERDARVRAYLQELEGALRVLPAPQAAELMEQITAHLDEALLPDSSEQTVMAVLRRLGSPAKLAAEAQTNERPDEAAPEVARPGSPRRPLRYRFSKRGWSAIATALALVCVLTTVLGLYLTTPSLSLGGLSAWYSPQDEALSVDSSTLGADALTVPARRGQWQGFVFEVENPGNSAQTVLGMATRSDSPTGLIGMSDVTDVSVAVSTFSNYTGGSIPVWDMHFTTGQTIQPGQYRFIRVLWMTDACSANSNGGGLTGTDQLDLEVQVGWFSHEEDLTLLPGWQLQFGPDCSS